MFTWDVLLVGTSPRVQAIRMLDASAPSRPVLGNYFGVHGITDQDDESLVPVSCEPPGISWTDG